jgi:predicted 3-demethylubiquinone-9 3-methyltransferase (glyoxalase superfamily)
MNSQKIVPCLWFDGKAEDAVKRYTALFKNSKVISLSYWGEASPFPSNQVMACVFELGGQKFHALDAGPQFKFNPAISFFVSCESETEVDSLWNELIKGGATMMPLDTYPWSAKYGWVQDSYGISWQLMMTKPETMGQKIIPALMYTGAQAGKAEEAIKLYTTLFKNSGVKDLSRYQSGEGDVEGTIKHGRFMLEGQMFIALDSSIPHAAQFTEAISLFVSCETQDEIDHYWYKLTTDGGKESQCGWLKDKFGVSWQIVPGILFELMNDKDKAKAGRVMQAMMQMGKMDISVLKAAHKG